MRPVGGCGFFESTGDVFFSWWVGGNKRSGASARLFGLGVEYGARCCCPTLVDYLYRRFLLLCSRADAPEHRRASERGTTQNA